LKTSYGGGGWQKTSEYRHMGEKGSKIAQKTTIIWYFKVPLCLFCEILQFIHFALRKRKIE